MTAGTVTVFPLAMVKNSRKLHVCCASWLQMTLQRVALLEVSTALVEAGMRMEHVRSSPSGVRA